jgi:hypothetical protein
LYNIVIFRAGTSHLTYLDIFAASCAAYFLLLYFIIISQFHTMIERLNWEMVETVEF